MYTKYLPEICFLVLLHVQCLICERCYVQVSLCGKHASWKEKMRAPPVVSIAWKQNLTQFQLLLYRIVYESPDLWNRKQDTAMIKLHHVNGQMTYLFCLNILSYEALNQYLREEEENGNALNSSIPSKGGEQSKPVYRFKFHC